jgi:hypothetical protein
VTELEGKRIPASGRDCLLLGWVPGGGRNWCVWFWCSLYLCSGAVWFGLVWFGLVDAFWRCLWPVFFGGFYAAAMRFLHRILLPGGWGLFETFRLGV